MALNHSCASKIEVNVIILDHAVDESKSEEYKHKTNKQPILYYIYIYIYIYQVVLLLLQDRGVKSLMIERQSEYECMGINAGSVLGSRIVDFCVNR